MPIRLRVGAYGKIPEIFRGKRTAFIDVDGGSADIDAKGDIVTGCKHPNKLLLPYNALQNEEQQDAYATVVNTMKRQLGRILAKRARALVKRRTVRVATAHVAHQQPTTAAPVQTVEDDDEDSNVANADMVMNSMFANVTDIDLSALFEQLKKTGARKEHDDEDDEEEEDEEENEDAEEDDDDKNQEEDREHEFNEEVEDDTHVTCTIYHDDKLVHSGAAEEELEDDDEDMVVRKKRTQESDNEEVEHNGEDDEDNLGAHMFEDEDDFDMYDGLAEVFGADTDFVGFDDVDD